MFELELDPGFGQLCCRGVLLLRGAIFLLVVAVPGFCDFELPLAAANATPPPAATADTTASARMRLIEVISPPFDARSKQAPLSGG